MAGAPLALGDAPIMFGRRQALAHDIPDAGVDRVADAAIDGHRDLRRLVFRLGAANSFQFGPAGRFDGVQFEFAQAFAQTAGLVNALLGSTLAFGRLFGTLCRLALFDIASHAFDIALGLLPALFGYRIVGAGG